MRRLVYSLCLFVFVNLVVFRPLVAQTGARAEAVKREFLHAWNAYKQYA